MRTPEPWSIPTTPFTLAHVRHLGVTRRRLTTGLQSGRVVRLRHGVYIAAGAVPDDPVSMHLIRAMAEQVAGPGRVASFETAALAHGLPLLSTRSAADGPVSLTTQMGPDQRARRSAARRLRLGDLPPHHVMSLPSGLVATTPSRTAADIALGAQLPAALMIVDSALRAELENLTGSVDRRHYGDIRLATAAERPVREALEHVGRRRPHQVTGILSLADARRESPLESFSAAHMHLSGLPRPRHQARIRTAGGDQYPDNLWEEYRLVGEADGEGKYEDSSAFTREKIREGHLRDAGYEVVRWTGREAFSAPHRVMDRIARALVARGWTG